MAQEAIERTILSFHPEEGASCHEEQKLGRVEGTVFEAVYGIFPYQMRVTTLPGEPLISAWTRQPVLALIGRREGANGVLEKYRTLAYPSDIRSLPEGVAERLAANLDNWQSLRRRITGEWEV